MSATTSFHSLGLASNLLSALQELGYETPTPIQEQTIPVLLEGKDLSAQAQTGTGKTAAFALPILGRLEISAKVPQALIVAPTRELAIQVAEAFQSYAKHIKGFHVTPIYGGQEYRVQLNALKRGPHVIVGTPGRVMDHIRRGSLSTEGIKTVVLDEADEMLKMGFIDDVEWILEQIPGKHQTALFSATMPASIQEIADRHLVKPKKVKIEATQNTVEAIEQFYTRVPRDQKLEALTRFLEVEEIQGAIIFARTKNYSMEIAEKLLARGYAAAALNGDMNQSARIKVIEQIKKGTLDIVVATDIAARGIDVDRISHVINYDIPHDTESYIHRIGRTGRAGRKGKAILFVTPREQRLLKDLEKAIGKPIKQINPPSVKEMKEVRSKQLTTKIVGVIEKSKKLGPLLDIIDEVMEQGGKSAKEVAAALVYLMQQSNPLSENEIECKEQGKERGGRSNDRVWRGKPGSHSKEKNFTRKKGDGEASKRRASSSKDNKPRRSKSR